MSELACLLKAKLVETPEDCFETLTFGELAVGQKFIALPLPGDNGGHGGLRGVYFILTKTRHSVSSEFGMPYVKPYGQAVNSRSIVSNCPHSMPVIRVE